MMLIIMIYQLRILPTMSKKGHQPQRFDVFNELKDGSGFTLPGNQHIFKYDRYGGWYDEFANYYGKNGSPEDPPSEEEYSDEHEKSEDSDDYDEFEKEFGRPKDYFEQEEDHGNVAQLERIASNIQILKEYPSNQPFRVNFNNVGYFSKRQDVFSWYQGKVSGITNLIFFNNEKGFNGKGYFIVSDIKAGEDLIKLQGEKYGDRQISFQVDNVDDFLLTPLTQNELAPFKVTKKYVNKSQGAKQQTAPVSKPVEAATKPKAAYVKIEENERKPEQKVQVKPAKIQQKKNQPVVEVKEQKLNPDEFATFTFKKKIFPKKTSFKEWLKQNKFTADDCKEVDKIIGNEDYARITMKNKVYQQLNNAVYNGEKIVFTPA